MPGIVNAVIDRLQSLDDISNPGFTTIAGIVRLAGAIQHLLNAAASLADIPEHIRRNLLQLLPGINPLAHSGLVGNHKDMITGIRQAPQGLQRPGNKMKIPDPGHIKTIAGKFINDAVSVEENNFHATLTSCAHRGNRARRLCVRQPHALTDYVQAHKISRN